MTKPKQDQVVWEGKFNLIWNESNRDHQKIKPFIKSLLLSQRQEILREVREKVKENFNQKIKEAQQDDLRVYSKVLIDVRDIALEELSSFLSDMEGKE